MLIKEEIKFQEMHNLHYTHILSEKTMKSQIINKDTKNLIRDFISNNTIDINLLGETLGSLYKEYLKIRKETIK